MHCPRYTLDDLLVTLLAPLSDGRVVQLVTYLVLAGNLNRIHSTEVHCWMFYAFDPESRQPDRDIIPGSRDVL